MSQKRVERYQWDIKLNCVEYAKEQNHYFRINLRTPISNDYKQMITHLHNCQKENWKLGS